MLFENVFQLFDHNSGRRKGCDLMLFENVFQLEISRIEAHNVVI